MQEITYVGKLVGIVADGSEMTVQPRVLGVLSSGGLVTCATRADLDGRAWDAIPNDNMRVKLERVLYDRERMGYEGKHWYHETPNASAYLSHHDPPRVFLEAPREEKCEHLEGDFLCTEGKD
jgi:predicted glycosyltransferase involved in capsule biosynthesis|tara:strand:+ start:326 stop:691 length:366 start_codon:yes stop_codon:yes gene_type:complete